MLRTSLGVSKFFIVILLLLAPDDAKNVSFFGKKFYELLKTFLKTKLFPKFLDFSLSEFNDFKAIIFYVIGLSVVWM